MVPVAALRFLVLTLTMTSQDIVTGYAGRQGSILLDPKNLYISDNAPEGLGVIKLAHKFAHSATSDQNFTLNNTDFFGRSIAMNGIGDILAVGANGDDTGGTNRGAVYLFNLNPDDLTTTPTFRYKLDDMHPSLSLSDADYFGTAISLNGIGDILAVGSILDDAGGTDRGAAYLFNIDPADLTKDPELRFKIDSTHPGFNLANSDYFGSAISLNGNGDILAVGSLADDTGGTDRGAVYLFNIDPVDLTTNPNFQFKIDSTHPGFNLANGDYFGSAISLNGTGDILAVGSESADSGGTDRGAAYLFNLETSNLTLAPTFRYRIDNTHPTLNLSNNESFGYSIALNQAGNILAVGSPDNSSIGSNQGTAYLFNINPDDLTITPTLRYTLNSSHPSFSLSTGDFFGYALALNATGNILAVGAAGDNTGGTDRGSAYLFNLNTADLTATPTYNYKLDSLHPGFSLSDDFIFGSGTALNGIGNILAVASPLDNTGGTGRGAAYLFNLNPNDLTMAPTFRYKLDNSHPGFTLNNNDNFGSSVALNTIGDILAVGAVGDSTGGTDRGAAYLFNLNPLNLTTLPTFRYKLDNSHPGFTLNNDDIFGRSVALNGSGDVLAIGALELNATGRGRGAAYLFNIDPANLTAAPNLRYKLNNSHPDLNLADVDFFGYSLSINSIGNILIVGSPNNSTGGTARGTAYIFNLDPTNLTTTPILRYTLNNNHPNLNLNDSDFFGGSLALNADGNVVAVGAFGDDTGGSGKGAVYLLNIDTSNLSSAPILSYKLDNNHPGFSLSNDDFFGSSLALNANGDILVAGTVGDDTGGIVGGAVYIFNIGDFSYEQAEDKNTWLSASMLSGFLSAGNNLTLQANNDITINSAITANNPSGNGGDLTFQAGRSIIVNGAITTDSGNLTLQANTGTASGTVDAYRDAGAANINLNANINTGTGSFLAWLDEGLGLTNNTAGSIITNAAITGLDSALFKSSGGITVGGNTISTATASNPWTFLAQGNISFLSSVQHGGSGALNIIAGWDGITEASATPATFSLASIMGNTASYGNSGNVTLNANSTPVAVGSRLGSTNLFSNTLTIQGGNTVGEYARLGYRPVTGLLNPTGNINVTAKGDITQSGGSRANAEATIGHGRYAYNSTYAGDITIAANNYTLNGGSDFGAAASVGHGAVAATTGGLSSGDISGNISITTIGNYDRMRPMS